MSISGVSTGGSAVVASALVPSLVIPCLSLPVRAAAWRGEPPVLRNPPRHVQARYLGVPYPPPFQNHIGQGTASPVRRPTLARRSQRLMPNYKARINRPVPAQPIKRADPDG